MNNCKWLVVLIAIIFTSCNKDLVGFKKGLVVDDFGFEYFAARAKISYDDGKQKINAVSNIRVRKDSIIWMSISKLGIEGARLKVDQDSIYVLNRLKKNYSAKSFKELSKQLDFDVDYNLIESVVLGNLIYPYSKEELQVEGSFIQYNQMLDNFEFNNYIGSQTKKLEKLIVEDTTSKATISVNYRQFQEVEDEIFPFNIAALVKYAKESKDDIRIDIGFSRAEIRQEPLSFPFGAPSRYTRL